MAQTPCPPRRGDFPATVMAQERLGADIHRLALRFEGAGAAAFAGLQPGQFAELDLSGTALPPAHTVPSHLSDGLQRHLLLRRPFSFSNVTVSRDAGVVAELIYAALGPATLRMTTLRPGDRLAVIGPLGRGFARPENLTTALLVAGGLGTPPILHLAHVLAAEAPGTARQAFVGARDREHLPLVLGADGSPEELARSRTPCILTTDDGSAGRRGLAPEQVRRWLDEHADIDRTGLVLYACGPEPMLAALARLAADRDLICQVSLERRMACGFNLCQGCAVACRVPDQDEPVYRMCCQEGPVFDARSVIFADL